VLDSATTPQGLDIPRYRLHPLKGDLKGLWSVTVRANWRASSSALKARMLLMLN
jgi:toxin HigB-1